MPFIRIGKRRPSTSYAIWTLVGPPMRLHLALELADISSPDQQLTCSAGAIGEQFYYQGPLEGIHKAKFRGKYF